MKITDIKSARETKASAVEIIKKNFNIGNRLLVEPAAFSEDSNFLAITEIFSDEAHYDASSRVLVFDFIKNREIIVYTEKQGSIESLLWKDDKSLFIKAHSHLFGKRDHIWKAI